MLTQFSKILIIFSGFSILTACTSTPDDEKYGKIQGNFPRLVDVPDRPQAPTQESINQQVEALEQAKIDARNQAQKNFDLIKK